MGRPRSGWIVRTFAIVDGYQTRLELFIAIAFGLRGSLDHHPWEVDVPEDQLEQLACHRDTGSAAGHRQRQRLPVRRGGRPQLYYGELDEMWTRWRPGMICISPWWSATSPIEGWPRNSSGTPMWPMAGTCPWSA